MKVETCGKFFSVHDCLDILQRNKSKINGGVVSFYVCMVVEWSGEFLCMHGGGVEW